MVLPAANPADDAPHLLVVDDDRRIRALLSRYLSAEGYRVSIAETAKEARAKLEGLKFDLLILDVMMPGENGFDLARARSKPFSPGIMTSRMSRSKCRPSSLARASRAVSAVVTR